MSLGIYLQAEIKEDEDVNIFPYQGNPVFSYLKNVVSTYPPHELMKRYLKLVESEDQLRIRLHPAEESAVFKYEKGTKRLTFSAKTNSAGPGYHVFLARLLAQIEEHFEIEWREPEPANKETSTGLARHLNLFMVQEDMLTWLHSSAKELISMKDIDGVSICMPKGYGVVGDYFVMSPLGFWDRKWFEGLAKQSPNKLRNHGQQFFPWWEEEYDAGFWLNWALSLAWTRLPWHCPTTDEERKTYRLVLDSFDEALSLNQGLSLPEEEIAEIKQFLESSDRKAMPAESGIGFNRQFVRKPLPMGWNIVIPGYYYSKTDESKKKVSYWFGDRKIISSIHHSQDNGFKVPEAPPRSEKVLYQSKGPIQGWARVMSPNEIETSLDLQWSLEGYLTLDDHVCYTRFFFKDPEDKHWAIQTWRSIFHPLTIKKVVDQQKTSKFKLF